MFLAKVSDPRRLDWCIDAFLAESQRPFVLFLTSKRILSSRNEASLDARGCLVIQLEQALIRNDEGEWILSPWAREQLVAFRDRLMPPAKTVVASFPTPNYWLDCIVGAAMAASMQGCVLFGTDGVRHVKRKDRVSFKELQKNAKIVK